MNIIFKTEFGSAVYGTGLPTSDKDYKSIYLPSAQQILLQDVPKVITQNTKQDTTGKNTKDDVDHEIMSLQQFLKLLSEGQTPMVDMLFAPKKHWHKNSGVWFEIQQNKEKLLTKRIAPIVGYVQQQAAKYGIKGSRMAAVQKTLEFLRQYPENMALSNTIVVEWAAQEADEFIKIVMIDEKTKGLKPYLQVCSRNVPLNGKVKQALSVYTNIYEQYGHRAEQAKNNEGVDWKACYHAVRIALEATELLTTGNITFPRPEAETLLQIRKGELPYAEVAELIEGGLDLVKYAQSHSTLRETPDQDWINSFVSQVHKEIVNGHQAI